jgi:predicted metal-dependent phosphotriesterase family hydrolase
VTVMTVLGEVAADELGFTLPHEHVFCRTVTEYRGNGLLDDEELAHVELRQFAAAGGGTVVDLTTVDIGRHPAALARAARATGLHIIMGCGHYRDPYLDRGWFDRHDAGAIADELVVEITDGVADTGIRPGIIGEVGCNDRFISAAEERSLRAAARAHRRTGLTVSTHAAWSPVGLTQLDLLESEGCSPSSVIIGHVDTVGSPSYALELARRGCWVQFDGFGTDDDYDESRALRRITELCEAGYIGQVLVSHDVFLRSHLTAYGGNGYGYVTNHLRPALMTCGFTTAEIDQITASNPQRALTHSPAATSW